ncbi:hypothetical protein Tco_1081682 [Tanacetum coccineum]|uniref:Uncharacterized protein n=1 Tax=Tanacetum coccineum TaxID=301880 RepID=A0ABQ5HYA4_9ASTR
MSNRHQELTSPEQTAPGKDFSNPFIVVVTQNYIGTSLHHVVINKHWLVQSKRLMGRKLIYSKFVGLMLNPLPFKDPPKSSPSPPPTSSTSLNQTHYSTIPQHLHLNLPYTNPSPKSIWLEYHPPTPLTHLSIAVHYMGIDEVLLNTKLILSGQDTRGSRLRLGRQEDILDLFFQIGKASDQISTAGKKKDTASEEVPPVSTAGVHISTAGETATYSRRSAEKRKDKGKGIMTDEEPKKKSKKELEQERLSFAEALRIEEQMHEEQRAQIARDAEIARQWDEEERKRVMDEAKATKKIDWNDPSVLRYHSLEIEA